MADDLAWWRAAVANPKSIGDTLKVTTTPERGYFRTKFKDGPWTPIAFWQDGAEWVALLGQSHDAKEVRADDAWTFACRNPISLEEYEKVYGGGEWSDVNPVVHGQRKPPKPNGRADTSDGAARPNAGKRTESQMLADDIAELRSEVRKFKKIENDAQAGEAQSVRSRLLELSGKADKLREAAKKPFLEGGKKIDAEWQPIVKDGKALADEVKASLNAFEQKKLDAQREAERAAAKAAAEAEAAKREAESSFFPEEAAVEAGVADQVAADRASVDSQIKGGYGRAASVSTKIVVDQVTDQDALYNWPLVHDHAELKALLLNLAQRAHKAGHAVPGVALKEVADVR